MQWLIDIVKDWILTLGYATEAWVLAKVYTTEAWVTEWFTPYSVTGQLNPNATCLYFKAGTHNSKPYYRRGDGAWFIWWNTVISRWCISTALDAAPPFWSSPADNLLADYTTDLPYTGIATVALGNRSLCTSYVDRGDPAAYDYDKDDLAKDGAWHDMDLSGIIPGGAKAVFIIGHLMGAGVDWHIKFRKKGNVNEITHGGMETLRAGVERHRSSVVALDADRKIEYKVDDQAWDTLDLAVKGWWL